MKGGGNPEIKALSNFIHNNSENNIFLLSQEETLNVVSNSQEQVKLINLLNSAKNNDAIKIIINFINHSEIDNKHTIYKALLSITMEHEVMITNILEQIKSEHEDN